MSRRGKGPGLLGAFRRLAGRSVLFAAVALVPVWVLPPGFAELGVLESLADRGPPFAAGPGVAFAAYLGGIGAYAVIAVTGESSSGVAASPHQGAHGDDAREDD